MTTQAERRDRCARLVIRIMDRPVFIQIPAWVARAGLRDDFVDRARIGGEEAAAAWCRRLKREAEREAA